MARLTDLAPEILLQIFSNLFIISSTTLPPSDDYGSHKPSFISVLLISKYFYSVANNPTAVAAYFPTRLVLSTNNDRNAGCPELFESPLTVARSAVKNLHIDSLPIRSKVEVSPEAAYVFANLYRLENLERISFEGLGPNCMIGDTPCRDRLNYDMSLFWGTCKPYTENVLNHLVPALKGCEKLQYLFLEDFDWAVYTQCETEEWKSMLRRLRGIDVRGGHVLPPTINSCFTPKMYQRLQNERELFIPEENAEKWEIAMADIDGFIEQFRLHWLPNLTNVESFHFRPGMNAVDVRFSRIFRGNASSMPKLKTISMIGIPVCQEILDFIRSHPDLETLIFRQVPILHSPDDEADITWQYLYTQIEKHSHNLISFDIDGALNQHGRQYPRWDPLDGEPMGDAYDRVMKFVDRNRVRKGLRRFWIGNHVPVPALDDYFIEVPEGRKRKFLLVRDGIENRGVVEVSIEPFYPEAIPDFDSDLEDGLEYEDDEDGPEGSDTDGEDYEEGEGQHSSEQEEVEETEGEDEVANDNEEEMEDMDITHDHPALDEEPAPIVTFENGLLIEKSNTTISNTIGREKLLVNEKNMEIQFSMRHLQMSAWVVRDIPSMEAMNRFKEIRSNGGYFHCRHCQEAHDLSFNMRFECLL